MFKHFLLLFCVHSVLMKVSEGLDCFQCSTKTHSHCGDPFDKSVNDRNRCTLDIDSPGPGTPQCVKYIFEDGFIDRACAKVSDPLKFYINVCAPKNATFCYICDHDDCNSANLSENSVVLMFGNLFVFLYLFY